jgi:hypothetical protein
MTDNEWRQLWATATVYRHMRHEANSCDTGNYMEATAMGLQTAAGYFIWMVCFSQFGFRLPYHQPLIIGTDAGLF